jgi:hypothetical protein
MTDDRCSMCTRRIGPTVTGLCGYCVQHKCKPENADRIRAKRIAAERIREANAVAQWRANLERKYKPVVEQCQSACGRHGPPRGGGAARSTIQTWTRTILFPTTAYLLPQPRSEELPTSYQ